MLMTKTFGFFRLYIGSVRTAVLTQSTRVRKKTLELYYSQPLKTSVFM